MGRRRSVGRLAAAGVLASLLLVACGDGGAAGPADEGGTAAASPSAEDDPGGGDADGGGVTWDDDPASLGIIEPGVDVADEPSDVAAAEFRSGADGESLVVSDLVRTDDVGFAEVRWVQGALARIDVGTVFEVTELDLSTGRPKVSTRLEVGRVWSRLDDGAADYEVATDVGTAAVRGTGYLVACTPDCTFGVADGVVDLTTSLGVEVELRAGEQVTVDAGGQPGAIEPFTVDDPWLQENLRRDEEVGFPAVQDTSDAADGDRAQLARSRMQGSYQFSFTMQESSEDALVGQEVDRTWGFTPACDTGVCGGDFAPGDGGTEPFVWTGSGYATTWIDRPAGTCPDGSTRWLEDLAIRFVPTAFEAIDGQDVLTAVDAIWESTLTPTQEAIDSGCDSGVEVDQLLTGTGTRVG